MKYIVLQLNHDSLIREIPIIFPDCLVHVHVAEALANLPGIEGSIPISAGFCNSGDLDRIKCYGKSESLKLVSREAEDDKLLRHHDYLHGIK